MPEVVFQPFDEKYELNEDEDILLCAQSSGIPMGSACGGWGMCGACRITILNGKENLNQISEEEEDLREKYNLSENERIGCLTHVKSGTVEVTTSYW